MHVVSENGISTCIGGLKEVRTSRTRTMVGLATAVGLLFLVVFLLAGCTARPPLSSRQSPVPSPSIQDLKKTAAPTLAAIPNPVPAGRDLGTTRITWSTGNDSLGQVYVSVNGEPEVLFAESSEGSKDAPWVQTGHTYEFRLYAGREHSKLLATTIVTRDDT